MAWTLDPRLSWAHGRRTGRGRGRVRERDRERERLNRKRGKGQVQRHKKHFLSLILGPWEAGVRVKFARVRHLQGLPVVSNILRGGDIYQHLPSLVTT